MGGKARIPIAPPQLSALTAGSLPEGEHESSPVYDSVGVVNTLFWLFFGKTAQGSAAVRIRVSRAPFFAFISTLDTRILTLTIGFGSNLTFFLRFEP